MAERKRSSLHIFPHPEGKPPTPLKPSAWTVVANISAQDENGVFSGRQVPTFTLPLSLGLCSEVSAKQTARTIIDPMGTMTVKGKVGLPERGRTYIYLDVIREDAPLPRRPISIPVFEVDHEDD